jgi:hypothetical protein
MSIFQISFNQDLQNLLLFHSDNITEITIFSCSQFDPSFDFQYADKIKNWIIYEEEIK